MVRPGLTDSGLLFYAIVPGFLENFTIMTD